MKKKELLVKSKIALLLKELNKGIFEKEETIKLVLLAILSGESAFLLGEPGTAKSLIARRISESFEDVESFGVENKGIVKCFEYLMNQFSTPDEVFGPVSLEALKKDEYRRITDRFLPKAQFAFLDEIWKASPAIQNALLTILNEKKFHNGSEVQDIPLLGFLAASNELPAKGEGLEAIFDRFLVRIIEKPVSGDSDFFNMITAPKKVSLEIKEKISEAEIIDWQKKAETVSLQENCREVIRKIRVKLNELNKNEERDDEEKYIVSDRRWKKIVGLLKMSAFINGRSKINLSDCSIISYCLWRTEKQSEEVQQIVESAITETISLAKIETKKTDKTIDDFLDECNKNIFENQKITRKIFRRKKSFLEQYDLTSAKLESLRKTKNVIPNLNGQLVMVEGGNYIMGSSRKTESPMHAVTLSTFSIGKFPVTYRDFYDVMKIKASVNSADLEKSVCKISWYDAIAYCNKLSLRDGLKPCYSVKDVDFSEISYDRIPRQFCAKWENAECDFKASGYRLPTEAEWEFAARGGNNHDNYKFSGTNSSTDICNVNKNVSNSLGICNMSGGVNELCWDAFGQYMSGNVINPAESYGKDRCIKVSRGGSYSDDVCKCTVSARSYILSHLRFPNVGFRICRSEVIMQS